MSHKLTAIGAALLIAGCTRDYMPEPGASGGQIFQAACAECHKTAAEGAPGKLFRLGNGDATPIYIAHKVHNGSLMMPKFPNINGREMRALSGYVLEHNLKN